MRNSKLHWVTALISYSDLFSDQYFNTEKDTLTAEAKLKVDSTFEKSIQKNHVVFCVNLQQLIEKIKIDIDSTDFERGSFQFVLQQDTCEVIK